MTSPPFRRGWGWKENWVSKCRWYCSHAWRFSWSSTYSEKSRGLKKEPRGTQTWGENGRAMCREGLRPTSSEVSGRLGEGSVIEAVTGSLLPIIFRIMSITISAWHNMPFMIWHPLFVLTFWLFPPYILNFMHANYLHLLGHFFASSICQCFLCFLEWLTLRGLLTLQDLAKCYLLFKALSQFQAKPEFSLRAGFLVCPLSLV